MTRRVPELPAYLMHGPSMGGPADYFVVWCEHCRRVHRHTAGEGHREAHCVEAGNFASPYNETGYLLSHAGTVGNCDDVIPSEERARRLIERHVRPGRRAR
jgi:hypothetical protein